jgi:hypothetical protein
MIADIGPIPVWRDGAREDLEAAMRHGAPLGIVLGVLIGGLVDWLLGSPGFAMAGGLVAGGLLGHLVSPPVARAARAGLTDDGGDTGAGLFDFGHGGVSGDGGSADCGPDGGSDGGGCDGGGGDGGGGD